MVKKRRKNTHFSRNNKFSRGLRKRTLRNHKFKRKRFTFNRLSFLTRKHPIATGIILIITSIILFRLSFTNVFLNSAEIIIWAWLFSIELFIAGILVLVGWWRNNISMLTTRHNINWKNR